MWQPGDLLSSSEKVVALCQGRVVYEEDVKPGLLARFLAPFASGTPDAFGVKHPAKMQFAINECGAARVLWAAICAGVAKLFGRTGVFYEMTGREVAGSTASTGRSSTPTRTWACASPPTPTACAMRWSATSACG